jgi:hypothetical protein
MPKTFSAAISRPDGAARGVRVPLRPEKFLQLAILLAPISGRFAPHATAQQTEAERDSFGVVPHTPDGVWIASFYSPAGCRTT